jgi:hypothetical protein
VPLLIGVGVLVVLAVRGDDPPQPVALRTDAPLYDTLGGLVAASDTIVVGDVVAVRPGRLVGSAAAVDAAVRTNLVEVRVAEPLLRGTTDARIVVEEIAALADGRPVTVDGQRPSTVGQRLLLFLTAGDSEDEPYSVAVNGQGRYELSPEGAIVGPPSLLPVAWTLPELRALVAGCLRAGSC